MFETNVFYDIHSVNFSSVWLITFFLQHCSLFCFLWCCVVLCSVVLCCERAVCQCWSIYRIIHFRIVKEIKQPLIQNIHQCSTSLKNTADGHCTLVSFAFFMLSAYFKKSILTRYVPVQHFQSPCIQIYWFLIAVDLNYQHHKV